MAKTSSKDTKTYQNTPKDVQNISMISKTYTILYVKESWFLDILLNVWILLHGWLCPILLGLYPCHLFNWHPICLVFAIFCHFRVPWIKFAHFLAFLKLKKLLHAINTLYEASWIHSIYQKVILRACQGIAIPWHH